MRATTSDNTGFKLNVPLPPKLVDIKPTPTPKDPLVEAVEKFPAQLAEAMAALPAPVMAPRPMGSWIIDVKRDGAGLMSGMTAKFHETK